MNSMEGLFRLKFTIENGNKTLNIKIALETASKISVPFGTFDPTGHIDRQSRNS